MFFSYRPVEAAKRAKRGLLGGLAQTAQFAALQDLFKFDQDDEPVAQFPHAGHIVELALFEDIWRWSDLIFRQL